MEVIYIGATWCITCKVIKPKTVELCAKFGVPLTLHDYDEDLEDDEKAEITKVPTLQIKKDGVLIETFNVNQLDSLTAYLTKNVTLTNDDF
jgi:thiol-disulfide isomerase/thioredoxin